MLGPDDVGHRVVVRRIVGVRHNRPQFTDVLGELVAYDATGLTVAARTGPQHIRHDDVQAAKRVPRSRDEIADLERAANDAWPAPVQERLGDWLLRAADGWTGRANSALPVGDPGMGRDEAVEAVVDWYAARGLPPRINVPLPLARGLDAALTARGWARSPEVLVLTAPLSAILATAERDLPPVRLDETPDEAWLAVITARKKGLPAAARQVLTGPAQVRFASVERDLAVARGAVVGGWLHLSLLEVAEPARRRGLARHVTRALAAWASASGAGTAFLQVESGNPAARALYAGMGFSTHHTYVTRSTSGPPSAASPPSTGRTA